MARKPLSCRSNPLSRTGSTRHATGPSVTQPAVGSRRTTRLPSRMVLMRSCATLSGGTSIMRLSRQPKVLVSAPVSSAEVVRSTSSPASTCT